jgi:hypothetical protein
VKVPLRLTFLLVFLISFIIFSWLFFSALTVLFSFADGPSVPTDPFEVTDVPASTPVSPVSGDETLGQIISSFTSIFIAADYLTCFFYCRCHTGGCETRLG